MLTLEVQQRGKGAADDVRRRGFVPAVLYGRKDSATSLAIEERQLERTWKMAGHTAVVKLTGAGDEKETLIKAVQVHPVSGRIVHADFYALEKGKKVQLSVPLEFTGEAPAEKAGYIIVKTLHEIEIEVAPADLPRSLNVDMSTLAEVGDHILASDIQLPASALLRTGADEIVASVTTAVEEKEEAPAAPAPEAAPEAAAAAPGDEATPTQD